MSAGLAVAIVTEARVIGVEHVGDYRVLSLRAAEIARRTIPGQFVMLSSGALLRRPFSVFRSEEDAVGVAFDVIGPGTEWLAGRALGDEVSIVGPLGTGFSLDAPGPVIAVGGGYGAAPLFLLAERMRAAGIQVHAVLGAARAARVFGADIADRSFDSVTFTTDDGSLGISGLVTHALDDLVARTGASRIAACGPMPMLEAVSTRARELGLPCGIGVCWTCVVPVVTGNGEPRFDRSCTEGPVFEGSAVAWG